VASSRDGGEVGAVAGVHRGAGQPDRQVCLTCPGRAHQQNVGGRLQVSPAALDRGAVAAGGQVSSGRPCSPRGRFDSFSRRRQPRHHAPSRAAAAHAASLRSHRARTTRTCRSLLAGSRPRLSDHDRDSG
jgi:hypothetical protein